MSGLIGYVVNAVSCLYIVAFDVLFMFPVFLLVDAQSMNYACLITGGLTIFVACFWIFRRKRYVGPKYVPLETGMLARDAV